MRRMLPTEKVIMLYHMFWRNWENDFNLWSQF